MKKPDPEDLFNRINDVKRSFVKEFSFHWQWDTQYRYLVSSHSPFEHYTAYGRAESFKWGDQEDLHVDVNKTSNQYTYRNTFHSNVKLTFQQEEDGKLQEIKRSFNLTVEVDFDVHPKNGNTQVKIFNEDQLLLSKYNKAVFDIYAEKGLSEENLMLGDDRLVSRFEEVIRKENKGPALNTLFEWLELRYNLQRLRFCIANMKLYHPYLDNPLWHAHYFTDSIVYPSHNSLNDERYLVFCEFAYQSLYGFWDRIGDLIYVTAVKNAGDSVKSRVYFGNEIKALEKSNLHEGNPHFQWLLKYKNEDFEKWNDERSDTVHHISFTSKRLRKHLEIPTDKTQVEEQQAWIEEKVDYFIGQYHKSVEGIRQLVLFLETKTDSATVTKTSSL